MPELTKLLNISGILVIRHDDHVGGRSDALAHVIIVADRRELAQHVKVVFTAKPEDENVCIQVGYFAEVAAFD